MFKTFSNIILALVMMLVTTGVTVTQHFCHNSLQNTGFFSLKENCREAASCCSPSSEPAHCESEKAKKDNCCKDENVFVKLLSQFTVSKSEQVTVFAPEAVSFEFNSTNVYPVYCGNEVFLKHPPALHQDIRVMFSTLLL